MLKAIRKYLPGVAIFFVVCASVVSIVDWIFVDLVPATSLIKFWILTGIVAIITLFVCGVLNFSDVKEKASSKAKEINKSEKAETVYKVIYFILFFILALAVGTMLAAYFRWNNEVTYWIATTFNEKKILIYDLIALVVVFLVEKISD